MQQNDIQTMYIKSDDKSAYSYMHALTLHFKMDKTYAELVIQ